MAPAICPASGLSFTWITNPVNICLPIANRIYQTTVYREVRGYLPTAHLRVLPPLTLSMVALGIQLSATPVLEQYIKDGKLLLPFSFPFHRQPIKGLYQLYRFVALLAALPSWMLRYTLRGWRPRRSWTLRQTITVCRDCINRFQFAPLMQAHSPYARSGSFLPLAI